MALSLRACVDAQHTPPDAVAYLHKVCCPPLSPCPPPPAPGGRTASRHTARAPRPPRPHLEFLPWVLVALQLCVYRPHDVRLTLDLLLTALNVLDHLLPVRKLLVALPERLRDTHTIPPSTASRRRLLIRLLPTAHKETSAHRLMLTVGWAATNTPCSQVLSRQQGERLNLPANSPWTNRLTAPGAPCCMR
jgi:hypothetical protein